MPDQVAESLQRLPPVDKAGGFASRAGRGRSGGSRQPGHKDGGDQGFHLRNTLAHL